MTDKRLEQFFELSCAGCGGGTFKAIAKKDFSMFGVKCESCGWIHIHQSKLGKPDFGESNK